MTTTIDTNRRGLLKGSAAGLALAGPLAAIMEHQLNAAATFDPGGAQLTPATSPYGPIAPVACEVTGLPLLQIPAGFSYGSFSWTGDLMSDGQRVNPVHDGMAVVRQVARGETVLIRNHEVGAGPRMIVPGNPAAQYDGVTLPDGQTPGGGCTVLRFRNGRLVDHRNAIGSTVANCAGGRTLWNSWLTCEETEVDLTVAGGKRHGYVFDVNMDPSKTVATPIIGMGRFAHEAIATDPRTGYIYQTEDARNESAFYRYIPMPNTFGYGSLARPGRLQAARVRGMPRANLLALDGIRPSQVRRVGDVLDIEWVTIPDPDASPANYTEDGPDNPDTGTRNVSGPFKQARELGALRMSRGEGIWWDHKSDCAWVVDTSFGYEAAGARRAGRGLGSVWAYRPDRANPDRGKLILVYAAAARVAGNNPDNITISPRGGLLSCDDGSAVVDEFGPGNRLMGYTAQGAAYILAKSNVQLSAADIAAIGRTGQFNPGDYRGREFAGATFDWTGDTLYLNIQSPGVTVAIRGPWKRGNL
ncbi:MAG: alkaline phosphatase PhoX [Thermaurantiacus sp.]